MRELRSTALSLWAAIAIAAVPSVALAQDTPPPRRILIVNENDANQVAVIEIARGLHHGLDDRNPTAFEIYSEYLESARFGEANLERMQGMLADKYAAVKLDAAIALGPRALDFMLDHRATIAPGVPLLFGAVSEETAAARSLPDDVKGVVSSYDIEQTMALARKLQPNVRQAVVMSGSAPFDKSWEATARQRLGDRYMGFDIRYLSELSLDGFIDAARKLPPDTAVLMLTIFRDADGRNMLPRNAAGKIAPASAAPVYSVYDTYLDQGIVGGYMGTFFDTGAQIAEVATRMLDGDSTVPHTTPTVSRPIVDWREIERYGLDGSLLPEGTETRFRAPSVWEDYKLEILSTVAILVLQAGMIAALIVQGRRRRRAEAELATERMELAHLSRASLLGELSGAFAHELNQPLTSILANAEAGRRLLDKNEPDLAEVKEILADIAQDDKRAADVITQLRRLLVKGEAALEPVDLNEAVTSTLALAKSELLVRQTRIDFRRGLGDVAVLGNLAQLQQVVLNLIVNAAEATSRLPTAARLIEITVARNGNNLCEVAVCDNGPGLTPEMQKNAFKPFVSSKSNGLGLGLAICRSIALAHRGTLQFDPARTQGARIVLALPAHGGAH